MAAHNYPVSGTPTPSSSFPGHQTCKTYMYTDEHASKILIHIKEEILKYSTLFPYLVHSPQLARVISKN